MGAGHVPQMEGWYQTLLRGEQNEARKMAVGHFRPCTSISNHELDGHSSYYLGTACLLGETWSITMK